MTTTVVEDLDLMVEDVPAAPDVDVVLDATAAAPGVAAQAQADAAPVEPEVDPGTASLREQLAAETRRRAEAEQQAATSRADAAKAKGEVADQQRQIIVTSIETAKARGDQLERELGEALTVGDTAGAARIQRAMAKAEAELHAMESARLDVETQRPAQRTDAPVEGRVSSPIDPVENLAARLSSQSGAWLRQHPECARDEVLFQEMIAADARARRTGLAADTPEYFAFIEQKLGLTSAPTVAAEPVAPVPARRQAVAAAPVSRDAVSLTGAPGGRMSVRLSADEQEQAQIEGMTNEEYARLKLQIKNEKARMN